MSTGSTTFTTTHRVINRVHNDTSVVRTNTKPTLASGLTVALQTVVCVGHNTNGCAAGYEHHTGLA